MSSALTFFLADGSQPTRLGFSRRPRHFPFAFSPSSTRRRFFKMDRCLAIADTVRFNFRAIDGLSIFESSSARSCASSAGVHRRPVGRGPIIISPSPSARARQAADDLGPAGYIRLTPSPSITKPNRQRIASHARRLRR